MRILITGASGFLGARFYQMLGKEHNVAGTYFDNTRRNLHQCDITNQNQSISLIQDLDPDVIIHTAGISDPDECFQNEQQAFDVNAKGTANIADAAKRVGAKLLYISTSFVFSDGGKYSSSDNPNPDTIYGKTKLKGEQTIQEQLDNYIILRCPKLFGLGESSNTDELTSKVLASVAEDGEIELDDSTQRFPVFIDDVVTATQRLLDVDAEGIYHISTHEPLTKFEFGKLVSDVFEIKGNFYAIDADKIVDRPSGIELETASLERLGIKISPVMKALKTIRHQRACSFKHIYSFKPDELIEGKSASSIRANLGRKIGEGEKVDADIVVPIPESGIYPATGYADETGIPLYHGIIRDYETEKTLYEPNIEDRTRKLRKKLVTVKDIIQNKRIVLVDEAIISGLTLATVIDKCQSADVKSIDVRIPSPPMISQCFYDVLDEDADLVAANGPIERKKVESRLAKNFDLRSLRFLSVDQFEKTVPTDYGFVCTDCFRVGDQT